MHLPRFRTNVKIYENTVSHRTRARTHTRANTHVGVKPWIRWLQLLHLALQSEVRAIKRRRFTYHWRRPIDGDVACGSDNRLKSPWETVRKLTQPKPRETSLVQSWTRRPSWTASSLPNCRAVKGPRTIMLPRSGWSRFQSHRPGTITVANDSQPRQPLYRLDWTSRHIGTAWTCADWTPLVRAKVFNGLRLRHMCQSFRSVFKVSSSKKKRCLA